MQSKGEIHSLTFSNFHPASLDTRKYSSYAPILIVIGGATATGKSSLAIQLHARLNCVILSADSRQTYREFDIGTAKPSASERKRVPHYLIDICAPTQALTLAQYQREAQGLIQRVQQAGGTPLLVGGTGLYIDAVIKGLKIPPVGPQPALRSQFEALEQPLCHALLRQIDPEAAAHIHPHDTVRTQRALEVFYVTGTPISQQQGSHPPTYPILYLALDCSNTETLERRIQQRTRRMLEQGLVQEVAQLGDRYGWDLPLMNTLGYAEISQHLQGQYTLSDAEALIVKNTRQFAKRQRTWFRNRASPRWFDADAPDLLDQIWNYIVQFIAERSGL